MFVIIVDIVAVLLVAGGIALLARRPEAGSEAGIYARRIGGTMIAAFGLAIGLMVTVFHFAGG